MDKTNIRKIQCLLKIVVLVIISTAIVAYQPPQRTVLEHISAYKPPQKTVLEHISYWNRLRKFATLIKVHNLTHYFEGNGITVFVPTTKSYNKFMSEANKFGYNLGDPKTIKRFLLYHVGTDIVSIADMYNRTSVKTLDQNQKLLFFNSFLHGDSRIFTVNGARIVTADIRGTNGIVHIIDRFITPLQSPKPVAQFLEFPDHPDLAFTSISLASIVDPELKAATNNTTKRYTVFAPNDSFIMTMPKYGQDRLFSPSAWTFLKTVFWAHIIEDRVHFIPSLGELSDTAAKAGTIKFYRQGTNVYISNNKVRARIVEPNIPVANGVVHVIDDLLFYIYRNLKQKIEVIPNVRFIRNALDKISPDLSQKMENGSRTITLFLPTDDAFAKLPMDKQMLLGNNSSRLSQLLKDHMVLYKARDLDSFQDGETFFTTDSRVLTIHRIQDDVYVEGGSIRAKITVPDIGCTNGVIHLVSNVLFQRDFTIWEAIQGNSQLSIMKEFIRSNNDILQTLSSTDFGPLTVLLISDSAFNNLPSDTVSDLHIPENHNKLASAIKGCIVHGAMLSSSQIQEEVEIPTMSGHSMTLYNSDTGIRVIGSHIRANVVIEDIWCSNGILHIIDNILHIPTRTIKDEIQLRPTLSVMTGILPAYRNVTQQLSTSSEVFTMFVPSDQAFTYMPTYRAQALTDPELLKSIVKSHIVRGTNSFLEDVGNYTRYSTEEGGNIFIIKGDNKVYVASNNVKADIVSSNVRCTNGMMHIVDTLLFFPYETVAETMESRVELRPFYEYLKTIDEFLSWASQFSVQQTVFVPSAEFLSSLADHHKTTIAEEQDRVRKIFEGHFLPGVKLDEKYLNNFFKTTRMYRTASRYNTTFTLVDARQSTSRELATVDVGYTNLKHVYDLVLDGISCSNGVIYIIDGFLNYPLNNIPEELKEIPNISIGVNKLLQIIPANSTINLTTKDTVYTMFVPADVAFNYLTFDDISYINANITYSERAQITNRHIIEGQQVTYDEILNGEFNYYLHDLNISVISRTDGLYLKWRTIETKVIRENILATNGIIHIVDKFMLSTPYQTTTVAPTSQSSIKHVSSSNCFLCSLSTLGFSILVTITANLFICR